MTRLARSPFVLRHTTSRPYQLLILFTLTEVKLFMCMTAASCIPAVWFIELLLYFRDKGPKEYFPQMGKSVSDECVQSVCDTV